MDDFRIVCMSTEENLSRDEEATETQHIKLSASCSTLIDGNDFIKDFHFANGPNSPANNSNVLKETVKYIAIQPKFVCFDIEETRTKSTKHVEQMHLDPKQFEHICAFCLKSYKDKNLKLFHMQTCDSKNQFFTKQLFDDIHLEDRQSVERENMMTSCNFPKFVRWYLFFI